MFDTQKIISAFSKAWAAGDVDGVMALFNDDPVYRTSTGGGTGTTFSGRDEVRSAVARMTQNARRLPISRFLENRISFADW